MHFFPLHYGAVLAAMFATLCTPQYTVPPDISNCMLNASSPFSWVVMILDKYKKYKSVSDTLGSATQGAMLTYKAVITTATYFKVRHNNARPDNERYLVVGQRIWDWRNNGTKARTNPCSQRKPVEEIHYHPKAEESNVRRFIFDYAIIIMQGYFNVTPPTFPTMLFPKSPYEVFLSVQYANVKNDEECAIPIPDNTTITEGRRKKLVFNERIEFSTIKFHLKCIDLLCEFPDSGKISGNCHKVLMNRPNATMLCAYPSGHWTKKLVWDDREVDNPYAGTPYICNGSTLGIVTQQKRRAGAGFKNENYDFFLIITFLRVYNWLVQGVVDHSPKFTPFYIETASLKKEAIEEPYKEHGPFEEQESPLPNLQPFSYPTGTGTIPKTNLYTFFAIAWMTF